MTDRQTTHAPGCWDWGPRHYECAVGRIERDEALLRQALNALDQPEHLRFGWTGKLKAAAIAAIKERLK